VGTNELHGSIYEFLRNSELGREQLFANRAGLKKPFRQRQSFGVAAGGPIIKNKTFIFGDYEGLTGLAGTVRFSSVPQPIWRDGMFATPDLESLHASDTARSSAFRRQPPCNDGAGNCWKIPNNLIDPVGRKVITFSPTPTRLLPDIRQQFRRGSGRPESYHQFDLARRSHRFG